MMKNILVINGSHPFAHAQGKFNTTIFNATISFFESIEGYQVISTSIKEGYNSKVEAEKFKWADLVIYHTPIWWFQLPHGFKKYLDVVLTEEYRAFCENDGRIKENPEINYGTGGLMHGKKYILTTSCNAPKGAFSLENEFFNQRDINEGVMFGFHKMNEYVGMELLATHHFYDIEKNADVPLELNNYSTFLNDLM